MSSPRSFADSWAALDGVEGWLTEAQARRLHDSAVGLAAAATVVEIGSFRGRSAIVLGGAVPDGVEVVAIDPHAGTDRGPKEIVTTQGTGDGDHEVFTRNLASAGVASKVRHVRKFSDAAHGDVDGPIDLLFIDGAHRYAPALVDIVEWGGRVRPGGTMLIHDAFNAVGVTLAQFRALVFSSRWRYQGRSGSLAEYRRTELGSTDRLASSARQLLQIGYVIQSQAIKVALSLGLKPLARLFGHRTADPWPY